MIENWSAHFLAQSRRQLDDLPGVPEGKRAGHFLLRHLDPAIRSARYAAQLKIVDETVLAVVAAAHARLVRLRDALAHLHETGAAATRASAVGFRGGAKGISTGLGR